MLIFLASIGYPNLKNILLNAHNWQLKAMFTRLRKFSSSVFLYGWFWLAQPPIGFGLFFFVCVFKSPKKDENWYELPGLKNYEKLGVEYGCLGALGNNRVRLKISQTSRLCLWYLQYCTNLTLFYSLSTHEVNLDEFMFLGNQATSDSKHYIRVEMRPIHLKDSVCALTSF